MKIEIEQEDLLNALMFAEQIATGGDDIEYMKTKAWGIAYVLQNAWKPHGDNTNKPDNYDEVLAAALADSLTDEELESPL